MSYSTAFSTISNYKYIIIFIIFQVSVVFSQSAENEIFLKRDLRKALEDGKQLVLQPGEWKTDDWLKFSAVIGGTALLTAIDEEAQDFAHRNPKYSESFPMKFGKWFGEPLITFAFAGGLYTYGLLGQDETTKEIGLEVAETFIYAGLVTTILKVSIGRERPYMDKGAFSFLPFTRPLAPGANDHFALPSGHSTVAFSLATVLASHTDNYLLKTAIYTPAVLTLISRVYQDQHWVSDVFLGAVIGHFVGGFIVKRHSGKNEEKESSIQINYLAPGLVSISIPLN